jgi:hypothetical protein
MTRKEILLSVLCNAALNEICMYSTQNKSITNEQLIKLYETDTSFFVTIKILTATDVYAM